MSKKKEPRLYQFRVELLDMTPVISRELIVESELSLFGFHEVLQTAFGWTSMHAHRFAWADPTQGATAGVAGGGRVPSEESTPLHVVADSHATFFYEYLPTSDEGDNYRWRHRITVIGSEPGALMLGGALAIGGTMNGPPEHCEGPAHYKKLLTDFVEGSVSKRKAAATELFRHGLFNPAYYDERGINMELQRLAFAA